MLPAAELQVAACIERVSDRRPWLARTLWGLRDQEGGWIGAAVRNSNGSDDLGPLQVNSWWASRIAAVIKRTPTEVRWWLRYDACFNVDAARWIFLSALAVTRDYWKAIGMYHSPVGWRQRRYTRGVANQLSARFGESAFRKGQTR
ncbi:MAG: TrbN/BfpH-like protein [Novosphingobium sp.]|nr:TrbN/BfpH-like protein [Novosphingobium sp.]